MDIKLTIKYKPLDDGRFFGQVIELPEILSEAANLEELKENMTEAISMYLEYKRQEQAQLDPFFKELELDA
ncbi:MAG: type II toxin-antitoxin system HicB family antitoxin [Cyclobacteriaceae bacterium]